MRYKNIKKAVTITLSWQEEFFLSARVIFVMICSGMAFGQLCFCYRIWYHIYLMRQEGLQHG